jgi:glutamate synthase domain-containing protein 3
MLAGDLVIVGNAGLNLGNYLIRGNIYIGGQWVSLGHNCKQEGLTPEDIKKLEGYLAQYEIPLEPKQFKKITPQSAKPFYK